MRIPEEELRALDMNTREIDLQEQKDAKPDVSKKENASPNTNSMKKACPLEQNGGPGRQDRILTLKILPRS